MKTQKFGMSPTFTFLPYVPRELNRRERLRLFASFFARAAVGDHKENRENGGEEDNPKLLKVSECAFYFLNRTDVPKKNELVEKFRNSYLLFRGGYLYRVTQDGSIYYCGIGFKDEKLGKLLEGVTKQSFGGKDASIMLDERQRAQMERNIDKNGYGYYSYPGDGKFTWTKGEVKIEDGEEWVYGVKRPDRKYDFEVRYDPSERENKWFEEKDRNYLARLYLTRHYSLKNLTELETKDLNENEQRAKLASEEVEHLPVDQLSPFLREFWQNAWQKQIAQDLQKSDLIISDASSEKQLFTLNLLQDNTSVINLSLAGLKLNGKVMRALVVLLIKNKYIKSLDLSYSQSSDDDIAPLFYAILSRQITTLVSLKAPVQVNQEFAKRIGECLTNNTVATGSQQVNSIPKSFECPITKLIMLDPVITSDGHTYQREAITEWLANNNTNPITRLKLKNIDLVDNIALRGFIQDFLCNNPSLWSEVCISSDLKKDLIQAINSGNVNDIRRFVDKDQRLLWLFLNDTETLLDLACKQSNPKALETVANLLGNSHLGNLFEKYWIWGNNGVNYFRLAAKNMGVEGAKIIAGKFKLASIDLQKLLFAAVKDDDVIIFEACLLLDAALQDNLSNIIHGAFHHQDKKVFNFLLMQKIDLNAVDADGNTVLHLAVQLSNFYYISQLIDGGINVSVKNKQDKSCLELAQASGNPELVTFVDKKIKAVQARSRMLAAETEYNKLQRELETIHPGLPKKRTVEIEVETDKKRRKTDGGIGELGMFGGNANSDAANKGGFDFSFG